ncbi:MAG: hypothetical protein Q4C96_02860 [Planctomycetia bacterium]|nr:hypothetical protein [Planctomycetia bacterium]
MTCQEFQKFRGASGTLGFMWRFHGGARILGFMRKFCVGVKPQRFLGKNLRFRKVRGFYGGIYDVS